MAAPERYANVAVNARQPARMPFTYSIPPGMDLAVGEAVYVPFGDRVLQGIVVELTATPQVESPRPIDALADERPVIDAAHAALARWLSQAYFAPLWECVALALPPGYGQRLTTMVSPVAIPPLFPVYPQDQKILRHLAAHGQVTIEALREAIGPLSLQRLERLQRAGYLTVARGLERQAGHARFERRVALARPPAHAHAHATEVQAKSPRSVEARLLHLLAASPRGDLPLGPLRAAGATPRHLDALATAGWLRAYDARVYRTPLAGLDTTLREPPPLSAAQQKAAGQIWESGGAWLLHGVTGSGKTEVYLDLVERTLAAGKGAIILVPEIGLTPQAVRRYGERLGSRLALRHSQLSLGELYDEWQRISDGEARVVIGSRSALFSPVHDLGLIVIDEEHDASYKQDAPEPRYHARETALELARLTGATIVLGSATPDLATYHRTTVGTMQLAELPSRLSPVDGGGTEPAEMPDVVLVDMRDELRTGNRSIFSRPLQRGVRAALAAREQAILFVNRRGAARFILCRDCGYLPQCPNCEVGMGLDSEDPLHPRTVCHHCGRTRPLEDRCPKCDGARYRPFGVGTQRVEVEARATFPGARVARWDSDVASRKGAHERIVAALEAHEIDILVGTQVLAKGLDLPVMTVVGVVDADVALGLPDFRAHERTFQLLTQVGGRAGRRGQRGWVYVQTYEPEAPPIKAAAHHAYSEFYEHEIAHRRRAGYPPFSRLVRLTVADTNRERGLAEASRIATGLRLHRDAAGRGEPDVLGPTPAFIWRWRGSYRWHILLRGRHPVELLAGAKLGPRCQVDVDPMNLL